jgi:hypothetical protein
LAPANAHGDRRGLAVDAFQFTQRLHGDVCKSYLFTICSLNSVRFANTFEAKGDLLNLTSIRPNSAA